jgi:hypothetical protein
VQKKILNNFPQTSLQIQRKQVIVDQQFLLRCFISFVDAHRSVVLPKLIMSGLQDVITLC